MKLYEYEVKNILKEHNIPVPKTENVKGARVVKAQVLTKNRKEKGGIKFADNLEEAAEIKEKLESRKIDGHEVKDVLIEEKQEINKEHYAAFLYDTETRKPCLVYSRKGGTGIEERNPEKHVLEENHVYRFKEILKKENTPSNELNLQARALSKLYQVFLDEDMKLLEINPLAKVKEGYMVIDAMAELDSDADYRHNRKLEERTQFAREKTEREIRAERIDKNDHRGIAGKYTELDGDIGMMLAGGGASLTNMDAIKQYGGEPANYTEYGGNPPTEKVYKLSKVIMSKEINGLWHVGGTANNTDIERTMKGFIQALKEEKPDYPIVVRRDGPNADKAFELLRETRQELGLNMKLYRNDTPMTKTAEKLMEMIEK